MILKRLILCALLSSVVAVHALQVEDEHWAEIEECWRFGLWQEQLQDYPEKAAQFNRYIDRLVDFQQVDADIAEQIIPTLCQTQGWIQFFEKRDVESAMQFIHFMIEVLQRIVWDNSKISFPIKLVEIEQEIINSGLKEEVFCTKLRQVFLIFTIVVSQMDYISRQGQAVIQVDVM